MLQEAVLVSAEDAEDGQAVVGFDPNDATLNRSYPVLRVENKSNASFCTEGGCEDVPVPAFFGSVSMLSEPSPAISEA